MSTREYRHMPACIIGERPFIARVKTLQSVSCVLERNDGSRGVDRCKSDPALDDEESFGKAYRQKVWGVLGAALDWGAMISCWLVRHPRRARLREE
jgi:hypothetical protein